MNKFSTCEDLVRENVQLHAAVWTLGSVCVVLVFIVMGLIYLGLPLRRQ